ncbi:MAG: hypothetical protein ACE5GK_03175 [Nitrospiria bacterium]
MKGFIYIDAEGLKTGNDLNRRVGHALHFGQRLPRKPTQER